MSLTAEQLQTRSTGVGGSDCPVAVGVSRWKTPYQLYLEKRGELPPVEENEFMRWGNLLEPLVRQEYAERTGRVVHLPGETLRHPEHGFMLCHPDGITDDGRLYEGKTTRFADGWGEPGTDEVPDDYLLQVQHNMLVTGAAAGITIEVADVAVLIAGSDWRRYEVPADRELQEMIVEEERAFWRRVEAGEPPPMATPEDVRLRYGRASVTGTVKASPAAAEACYTLATLKAHAKELETSCEQQASIIQRELGDIDTLVYQGEVIATWRAQKGRETIDMKALKADHPEIYQRYVKRGQPFRRLLLKVKPEGES